MTTRRTAGRLLCTGAMTVAFAAAVAAAPAQADPQTPAAEVTHGPLVELNSSGVTGNVTLVERAGALRVNLTTHGLEARQVHLEHLHGFGDGSQATCPDASLAGADGVLTFAEGLPAYGPPVITLGHEQVDRSQLSYSRTFDQTMAGAPVASLGDLDQYVVVVHGMTVGGSYEPTLPVACAVLTAPGR